MHNSLSFVGGVGFVVGLLISAYGHSANGFLVAPLIVTCLVVSFLGWTCTAILVGFHWIEGRFWGSAGAFAFGVFLALLLVPFAWPYSNQAELRPLSRRIQ